MKASTILLLVGLALGAGCTTVAFEPHDGVPNGDYPGTTWLKSTSPERLGWSSEKLAAARAYSERIGSAAVMIVDDGVVVDAWGDVAEPYQLHSIRKPLMGALIGIHVEEGSIDLSKTMAELGIDDNPPALSDIEKQATVYDLIRSRSGIYHPALGEVQSMKDARPPRYSHAPGTFWYYNNWDFNALGTIFEQETGTKICEEFQRRIAEPLLMEDFDAKRCWYNADDNSIHRYYGIRMSARDLARFGLLYLREGLWQDRRIVPPDWVRESTAISSEIGPGRGYGYLWNVSDERAAISPVTYRGPVFGHGGFGVHFLTVVPYRNLVVVHRVDTDEEGPYPRWRELNRLMWMILDAAGETQIGENPSLDATRGVRLTADNLTDTLGSGAIALYGTLYSGLVEDGDRAIAAILFPDNRGEITIEGLLEDKGEWWFEDGKVCTQWQKLRKGRTGCRIWVVDGQTVKSFDLEGTLADTYSLSPP